MLKKIGEMVFPVTKPDEALADEHGEGEICEAGMLFLNLGMAMPFPLKLEACRGRRRRVTLVILGRTGDVGKIWNTCKSSNITAAIGVSKRLSCSAGS